MPSPAVLAGVCVGGAFAAAAAVYHRLSQDDDIPQHHQLPSTPETAAGEPLQQQLHSTAANSPHEDPLVRGNHHPDRS